MKRAWVFALGFLVLAGQLSYAQIAVQGFVDTYHSVRLKEPQDYLASRTRVRLEMDAEGDDASIFASFNATKDYVLPSRTRIELREAYLEYAAESWDLRLGRQIIIWGKADGIAITDVISPMDYTEFLAQDYDDIRMPVDGLKLRYLRDQMSVEFIWIPVFQAAILPMGDNPWAFGPDISEDAMEPPMLPETRLKNSEIGGKVSFYLPGVDLAFSTLYTWNKEPVMNQIPTESDEFTIRPEHHRLTFVGSEFSAPYRSFVFRGESAFFKGRYFEPLDPDDGLFQRNTVNWLLGADWYPGSEWTLTAQFADFFILDYDEKISSEQHETLATLNVSKNLLRNTLTLSAAGYVGLGESQLFGQGSVDYALTDGLHLTTGIDVFAGDGGMFGQYKDNTEVWVKAKYSF